MSSILKALQKLEKEKTAKEDRPVRLAWEVMRPDRSIRQRSLGSLVLVVALIGVSSLTIYLLMNRTAEDRKVVDSRDSVAIARPMALAAAGRKVKSGVISPPAPVPVAVTEKIESKSIETNLSSSRSVLTKATGLTISLLEHRGGIKSIAVINDLPVMEGTTIEGYRVVAILPDKVLLEKGGSVFFVSEE